MEDLSKLFQWCEDNGLYELIKYGDDLIKKDKIMIRHCGLKEITPEIKKLKNLQILDLTGNFLSDLPELPPKISRLQIGNNLFRNIPESIRNLKDLTIIEAENNAIEELPEWMSELKLLYGVVFDRNKIKSIEPLSENGELRILRFNNNQVEDLSPIYGLKELYLVDFSNNNIQAFDKRIRGLKKLKHFCGMENVISKYDVGVFFITDMVSFEVERGFDVWFLNFIAKSNFLKKIGRKLFV